MREPRFRDYMIALLIVEISASSCGGYDHQIAGAYTSGSRRVQPEFLGEILFHASLHRSVLPHAHRLWILRCGRPPLLCSEEDHVTAARARGDSPTAHNDRLRGPQRGAPARFAIRDRGRRVVGGAVIIEQIFVYQGVPVWSSGLRSIARLHAHAGIILMTTAW